MSDKTKPAEVLPGETGLIVKDTRHHALEDVPPPQGGMTLSLQDDPLALVQHAMNQGASLEQIKEMRAIAKEMQEEAAERAFFVAMAAFKASCPPVIHKDAEVDFKTAKGRTHYRHASLGNFMEVVTPHLSANDLSLTYDPDDSDPKVGIRVTAELAHVLGHKVRKSISGPLDGSGNKNMIQQKQSTITYLCRGLGFMILGLSSGMQDDDGGLGQAPRPAQDPNGTAATVSPKKPEAIQHTTACLDSWDDQAAEPCTCGASYPRDPKKLSAKARTLIGSFSKFQVVQADLEGPEALGEHACFWSDEMIKGSGAVKDLFRQLRDCPAKERPAMVRRLFKLGGAK